MFRYWTLSLHRLAFIIVFVIIVTAISTDRFLVASIFFAVIFLLILRESDPPALEGVIIKMPEKVFVNDRFRVSAIISLRGGSGLINAELKLPTEFRIEDGTNVHLFYKSKRSRTATISVRLRALRRGIFDFGPLIYAIHGVSGNYSHHRGQMDLEKSIEVIPKIRVTKPKHLNVVARKYIPSQSIASMGPPSTDFKYVRDYTYGDPVKFINWKATARSGSSDSIMVNDYEKEGLTTTLIVLDRSASMHRGLPELNPFEYSILLIMSLVKILLERKINTGFWYGQRFDDGYRFLLPSNKTIQYQEIKRLLIAGETLKFARRLAIDPGRSFYRAVIDTSPNVLLVTYVNGNNVDQIAGFTRRVEKFSSRVIILNPIPYGVIGSHSGHPLSEFMGKYALRHMDRNIYSSIPRGTHLITWDPEMDGMSGVLVRLSKMLR